MKANQYKCENRTMFGARKRHNQQRPVHVWELAFGTLDSLKNNPVNLRQILREIRSCKTDYGRKLALVSGIRYMIGGFSDKKPIVV